jgi:CHAT domain-containing protein
LIAADKEAAAVAAVFRNAETLTGSRATVEKISLLAPHTGVFHFSGHGWSNRGNGGLLLPPAANGEPQFMTSRELAAENWKSCSLAVLSACLTATGEERGAANNESLVRAFLSAGVRNVMASRWSVDSEATGILMAHFYDRLRSGCNPATALEGASAQLASSREWGHPYYWAGFGVYGKDR